MDLVQSASISHSSDVNSPLLSCFPGFPESTLLESGNVPITEIAKLALREGQCTNPLYRVHRWFARRLGSQFRAILAGLSLEPKDEARFWDMYLGELSLSGATMLDPFMGGGTSLIEVVRCGASVIGYDIDPVATFITRFELEATSYDSKSPEITELCTSVSEQIAPFHRTSIPGAGERTVLHHFWVEHRTCNSCAASFEIHPHYQLAYNKDRGLQWVFCRNCHGVYELPITQEEIKCECGTITNITQGTLSHGKIQCPVCGVVSKLSDHGNVSRLPDWRLFAQEYLEETEVGIMRHFKSVTNEDRILYEQACSLLKEIEDANGCFAPKRSIPTKGRFDQRPLIHGIKCYRELFNDRQLLHLTLLGKAIAGVEDIKTQRLLAIAFSEHLTTNCMYTGYAFGYRRNSPMFSMHSYRHITRPVEINPWLHGIGRGTFPNVLAKIARAIEFAKRPTELDPRGGYKPLLTYCNSNISEVHAHPKDVLAGLSRAAILTKSSEDLKEIYDNSIDLILTDPPYFDNVSYSELSDFYLAWHQSLGIAEPPYDNILLPAPIEENLALTAHTDQSVATYQDRLYRIFCECYRVLKQNGIMVFTYHHNSPKAWGALGDALVRSGIECSKVLPMRGEGQGGLLSYNGTIKWDAVFVCRKNILPQSMTTAKVLVPKLAIKQAKLRADVYAKELAKTPQIGFRDADCLNLVRAIIVSSAIISPVETNLLPLLDALKTSTIGGC